MLADPVFSELHAGTEVHLRLPPGFIFTQTNLQDYSDCARRFLLRHLLRLRWPAVESEPAQEHERFMLLGQRFHHLAWQALSGVPAERLEDQIESGDLLAWWEAFARFSRRLEEHPLRLPEISLSAPFGDFRLLAQYDLLIGHGDGRFTIYDWKTSAQRQRRSDLDRRLQTRVYPYLLALAGAALNGGEPVSPAAIEMIYWFPAIPDDPERSAYSAARFEQDHNALEHLRDEIVERAERLPPLARPPGMAPLALTPETLDALDAGFARTTNERRCAFCVYRSLCDRGQQAGDLANSDLDAEPDDLPMGFDLEQIGEISF